MIALDALFQRTRAERRLAFLPFLPAGTPDLPTSLALLSQLAEAGADAVELGFPFSDPVADGPVIAASYTRALAAGFTVDQLFTALPAAKPSVPVVGMASVSLLQRRGPRKFITDAAAAGFAGLIVPDLPLEEAVDTAKIAADAGVSFIPLVTPATPPARAERIAKLATGFLYCVSVAGITGERATLPDTLAVQLRSLRTLTDRPLCVGFGVGSPAQVRDLHGLADGVIVGSALVRQLDAGGPPAMVALARELATAARSVVR